jgi:glycosyltransferase involved in cell wall biosynthesis
MLLTIGMMVKNEEKHLEECLEALTPIQEELDTELVIVDTGSDDNTVKIAKKFTDKVYFHEWNDNFSEMRNTVISYAEGDWYFSLDGDEIVNNPEGFIEFFKSGKYKNYNTALVTQKNYTDKKNDIFSMDLVPRIFKNDNDFHFEGAIHNQPRFKKPIYELDTILDHYGYIASDKELMEKKFKRTSTILKEELKKDPKRIYYWYQLSRSYAMHRDYKDALEAIIKAYDLVVEKNNDRSKYMNVYTQLAKMYLKNKRYLKAEEIAQLAISLKDGYLDLNYYLAKSQYLLNEREKSLKSFKKYIELVNDYDNINSSKDTTVNNETVAASDFAYKYIINLCAELEKNYDYALNSGLLIKNENQLIKIIKPFIDISLKTEQYIYLRDFFLEKAKDNIPVRIKFLNVLENIRFRLSKSVEREIINIFDDVENDDQYFLLNKVRKSIIEKKKNVQIQDLKKINFNKMPNFYGDIIYYILNQEKDEVYFFLESIKEIKLNKFIEYINEKHDDLNQLLLKHIDYIPEDLPELRTKKSFGRYLIAFGNEVVSDSNYIIDKYLEAGTKYINPELFIATTKYNFPLV